MPFREIAYRGKQLAAQRAGECAEMLKAKEPEAMTPEDLTRSYQLYAQLRGIVMQMAIPTMVMPRSLRISLRALATSGRSSTTG